MLDIKSMNLETLELLMDNIGERTFRAKQLFKWIHLKQAQNFDEMTNLPRTLRSSLNEMAVINKLSIIKELKSKVDSTTKYLFSLYDNNVIESVLMKHSYGNTLCISSQVGCKMGCSFCASCINGFTRNLSASEMLDQVYAIKSKENISNIVVMGGGEPFDNYRNLVQFIKTINSPMGINIGQRHITVSTCGLVEEICDFANEKFQVTLAISLHAPNDKIRREIMPIAKRHSLNELFHACRYYTSITNKRVTFEYALIDGVNDSEENAEEIAKELRFLLCHVNLIPFNEVKEKKYKRSSQEKINKFAKILEKYKVETTIRRSFGEDIQGACGQLRKRHIAGLKN